jgi:hypothetical protein
MNPLGGGAYQQAKGARNTMTVQDQTIYCATYANGLSGNGQTTRLLLGGNEGTYDEFGFMQKWCATGVKCYRGFSESSLDHTVYEQSLYTIGCLTSGATVSWQIYTDPAPGWQGQYTEAAYGYIDCTGTNTFSSSYLDWVDAYGYTDGNAEGEGFRRDCDKNGGSGCNNSSMWSSHTSLQWMDDSRVWHPASDIACRLDSDAYWNGNRVDAGHFNVITPGGQSCLPNQ